MLLGYVIFVLYFTYNIENVMFLGLFGVFSVIFHEHKKLGRESLSAPDLSSWRTYQSRTH
jgi:hypothetical protein